MKKIIFILAFLLLTTTVDCYGFWVWSAKTGNWVNPVYRIFDTAQEQFDWAKQYFDDADYRKAIFEFKKVIKKFRKSKHAAEAKFYIALSYEKLGKFQRAFKGYEEVIKLYPLNERLEEIAEREYMIGEKFFEQRKYDLSMKIFKQSLTNVPYGKVSDVVQYKIGLCLLKLGDYDEAYDEFKKMAENYGFSTYVDDAFYSLGLCSFKISLRVKDYDQGLVDRAVEDLEFFLRRYQTSDYVPEAQSLLDKLIHKKAKRLYIVAQFYEKQKKQYAAIKYYEELIYSYAKTSWAKKARPKLERLRKN
ncbi:MAG: outer membrane protein assembly factor BamD [Candidatus Omnitrophota bacterium]